MKRITSIAPLAGAIAAASFGGASAEEFSTSHSFAGGAFALSADSGGGLGVNGDVRQSLGKIIGDDSPDWLSRVRGGYDYHSDGDSRGWVETIQPLMQTDASTLFWQARVAYAHEDETINAGVGYRWMAPGGHLLLGVNAFYDHAVDAGHQRASLGGEAIGQYFTFRANLYQAASGWRDLGGGVTEHALDGVDASVDTAAPHMPWLRVGARYYEWNGIDGPDASGVQGTLKADVTDHLQFVGTYAGDEDPEGDYYLGVRVRLGGSSNKPTATRDFWAPQMLQARDLEAERLGFVERENRMVTESQGGQFATGTITVSRSE